MKQPPISSSPFKKVLKREFERMTSRRIYFGSCIVLPLFLLFFMATIFGGGAMDNLPIGIVDSDNTSASRSVTRMMEAVPTFSVIRHFTNEVEARRSVQQKEIYGYLHIPHHFEQNALTGKDGTLCYYYHYALLAVGGEIMGAFGTSLAPIAFSPIAVEAEALGVSSEAIETFLLPIDVSDHPVYNPGLNYSIYLSQPFYFVLFQILILLITVYSMGSEIKFKTAADWLACANGSMPTAIFAKLLPYTVIFCIEGILANFVIFDLFNVPIWGSWWLLNLATVLFVISTQALAIFIFALFPAVALIISAVSMLGSLGATLSGITFPVDNMYGWVRFISYLLPVRHYTEFGQIMFYTAADYPYLWMTFAILLIYPILAFIMFPHLKRAIISRKYEDIE